MSYRYSENALVQQQALDLLKNELGWEVARAYNDETFGPTGTFGRTSQRDIILSRYLRKAVKRINPWINDAQIDEALATLTQSLSTNSLLQTNEEKYRLLRDGIAVSVKDREGRSSTKKVLFLDLQRPENNDFLAVEELWIQGDFHLRRTDIVGFVNGIPLLFVELKRPDVDVKNAYTDNYTDYLDTIPKLFHCNAFVLLSNGLESRVGTVGSPYAFFHEWKRLKEDEAGQVDLETMLRGICRKSNFLDLFENFIVFDHSGGHTAKILARNHQYLGVNEAVEAYRNRDLRKGKLGVFWHTQGSGKSYSMVFLTQKIRRKFEGSPTFVILTDREELNRQISDTFENCGLLGSGKASSLIATSSRDLINKLNGNPSFIFTLIQKFNQPTAAPIIPNHDILILSDEAHRSQNGIFAENMMKLLPTAARLGFTGTPLFTDDNITERTFGGYISIYDFKRAVDDGATVPLYYENRGEKLKQLTNPKITDEILDAIERADLSPDEDEKLQKQFANEIHLLTAEPRLRAVAKDFAQHYSNLWTTGKAMFVCLNKVTCVRMFNLVTRYWNEIADNLERDIRKGRWSQQEAQEQERKLRWMRTTEMAVVISQEQNEIKTFRDWELDIRPHRAKMESRELDKEFKDSNHPLRIVFVCAMWLTGFDVKSLSCLYLDKPMKAHALMQTIARANRVAEGKSNGLIIDYIGIVKALKKALADYAGNRASGTSAASGNDPTQDKSQLIERLHNDIVAVENLLAKESVRLTDLEVPQGFASLRLLKETADLVCGKEALRKTFSAYAQEILRLCRYLEPDEITPADHSKKDIIRAIYGQITAKRSHVDTGPLMFEVNQILSRYVETEKKTETPAPFDISHIDFASLAKKFSQTKTKNLLLRDLRQLIEQRLASLIKVNDARTDFYERYQRIIESYNQGLDKAGIEAVFNELTQLAGELTEEERRYVREGFVNDEELAIFDKLNTGTLSDEDKASVRRLSQTLLKTVKSRIGALDHWTDKSETRASIDVLIRDTLWSELPSCYDDQKLKNCRVQIFDYMQTHYPYIPPSVTTKAELSAY